MFDKWRVLGSCRCEEKSWVSSCIILVVGESLYRHRT